MFTITSQFHIVIGYESLKTIGLINLPISYTTSEFATTFVQQMHDIYAKLQQKNAINYDNHNQWQLARQLIKVLEGYIILELKTLHNHQEDKR